MTDIIRIPVYMLDEEAKKFLLFQEHYKEIALLLDSGVFQAKNATILLDIDKFGVIKSIRRNDYLYSERSTKQSTPLP